MPVMRDPATKETPMNRATLTGTVLAATFSFGLTAAHAEIVSESFDYGSAEARFAGHVAYDGARATSRGTVLIVHDWDGMNDYEVRRAEMLAAEGYTAFAVDLFGAGADPQGIDDYRRLTGQLYGDRALFRARIQAALDAVADLPGSDGPVTMIGYCFGGAAVLEAARMGADLDGFVSFHGGLGTPEGQGYDGVTAPVMLFHGSADPVSGMADLAALLDELQAAGVPHGAQVFGGARHSFTIEGSRDFDAAADAGSWAGLLSFLDGLR
jgi:dienelactone hydrolase